MEKRYIFSVVLSGIGESERDAWKDVLENYVWESLERKVSSHLSSTNYEVVDMEEINHGETN